MRKLTRDELIQKIEEGSLKEHLEYGLELKSNWSQEYGKDISAIANKPDRSGGWLIVGVNDNGKLGKNSNAWLKETESKVSNHIAQYLAPDFTVIKIKGEKINEDHFLLIEITSPNEVVRWNEKAYKLVGTSSLEMGPDEILTLTLALPGADFSKMPYHGELDEALIIDFGKKLEKNKKLEEDFEVKNYKPSDILSKIHISDRNAAGILFGQFKVRIVHYNENDDILDQKEKLGLYHILKDDFVDEIQTWTRSQASQIHGNSISTTEETPYPLKALRETLANAVAHAKYSKDNGGVLVEIYPRRISISNFCDIEAKFFTNKWFSKVHKTVNNLLMECLKLAGISDELGSGKRRVFKAMIESGKREPVVEFTDYNQYATWTLTLYNEETDLKTNNLLERLKETYTDPEERRLIVAFVLWKEKSWKEIEETLDKHYLMLAQKIKDGKFAPFLVYENKIYLKRWVRIALDGAVTKKFTEAEELELKNLLTFFAFFKDRKGFMTFDDIKAAVGVHDTQSERVQVSRLLTKWAEEGFVQKVEGKRGEWQFLIAPLPKPAT